MISQLGGSHGFPWLSVSPSAHPRQRDCPSCCFGLHSQESGSLCQAQPFSKPAATSLGQAQRCCWGGPGPAEQKGSEGQTCLGLSWHSSDWPRHTARPLGLPKEGMDGSAPVCIQPGARPSRELGFS